MRNLKERYGEWAVVTGASSGIGLELARQLAARGLDVVLVARREQRLAKLAGEISERHGVRTKIVAADLSKPAGIHSVIREIEDLEVGLLVNNAGREDSGHFASTSVERALETIDLNCKAPLHLTHHFSQAMRRRGRGGIVFMSSIVAFQGVPYIANYAATKAYDLVFGESVGAELKPFGVDVVVVAPGFTRSELSPDFDFDGLPLKPMSPAAVARRAIESLGRSRVVIPGTANKLLYVSGKLLQTRRMSTRAFGWVFGRVLRSKLKHAARETSNPVQSRPAV